MTLYSVLPAAIFHASFDDALSQHSYDVVPTSQTVRFLIFSAVIVFAATTVIIATKGQLGRAKEAAENQAAASESRHLAKSLHSAAPDGVDSISRAR